MAVTRRFVRAVRRRTVEPFFRLLDLRFAALAERLETHTVNLARHHESINEQIVGAYNEGLNTTRALVRTEGEAVGEYVLAMARIEERITRAIETSGVEALPHDPASLDADVAAYLTWAVSADGLGRAAGMAPERSVDVRYVAGGVEAGEAGPRAIDVPLAHAACAARPSARVLDIGGRSRTLAFELASLGHDVVVLDPEGYAFGHPRLQEVPAAWSSWRGPDTPFDVIIGLSAGLDVELLERASKWLAPGGEILVSVVSSSVDAPSPGTDPRERAAATPALTVREVREFARTGPLTWVPVASGTPATTEASLRLSVVTLTPA